MVEFFTLTFVALLMIISPGPDFAMVVKNSLTKGRLAGIYTALGVAAANLGHVFINLLGIGIIIAESLFIFTVMKGLGACYLLYLGYKGIRAQPEFIKTESISPIVQSKGNQHSSFYNGLLTCLLNPKAALFFLSFFSAMLSPQTAVTTQIFYGVWISAMAFVWFLLVAVFFTSPVIGQKATRFKHWLERFTGVVLILLGLKLLMSEFVT